MLTPDLNGLHERVGDLIGISVDEFGVDENLIECGLQSLQMIKFATELRRRGVSVVFSELAVNPTVRQWHSLVVGRTPDATSIPAAVSTASNADQQTGFGLATMQHAYWIGRRSDQPLGGVAAHLYAEFDGPPSVGGAPIDVDRLQVSVGQLLDRHEMLRAVFDDHGRQHVPETPRVNVFSVVDLTSMTHSDAAAELEQMRDTRTHQRMPADEGRVTDITVSLLPDGRHRLHVDIDMLAADALSYRTLLADLAMLYRGSGDCLPPIDYSYRRYLSDKPHRTRSARERDRQWWSEHLDELPDPPRLPLVPEHERPDPHRTVRYEHWIDADAKRHLIECSRRAGVTPAVALAAVFAHVVAGWSSDGEFLLNVPLFDREPTHDDVELLSGDFSSSIMLPVDTSHATFLDLALDLQQRLHRYAAHSTYPGLDVLRDLGRLRGGRLLAPVVYTSGLDLGELFHDAVLSEFGDPVWIVSQGPQVVLDAQVVELRGGLLTNWDVREHAFPTGMMDAMFARHRELIDLLVDNESEWTRRLADPAPPEQRSVRVRADAESDSRSAATGRCIHEGFFQHAELTPDATAIIDESGEPRTYRAVADDALTIAAALATEGVRSRDVVAIVLPKGADQIVAVLGILAAGAAYLPIGADQPTERVDRMYRVASPAYVVTPESLAQLRRDSADQPLRTPIVPDPATTAYIMFTSGSTGEPKGVDVGHAAVWNTLRAMIDHFDVASMDRSIALSALEFDLSVQETLGVFAVGGSVVAVTEEVRHDGFLAAAAIREHGVTQLYCVPSVLDIVITGGERVPDWASTVRTVILGGDRVLPELLGRMRAVAPTARFAGLGGATETAIHHTLCEVDPDDIDPAWHSVPFGRPLPGVVARIVNDRGQDCPDWVAGELWIGGAGLAHGYRDDPDRTAERFVQHAGRRWYRTGDVARYLPGGTIDFVGRRDHQVKIRGFRIELGEIENALRDDPSVVDAIAAVHEDALVAAVSVPVERDRTAAGHDAMRRRLGERVPPYMIPAALQLLEVFPQTSNGKVDRAAVLAEVAESVTPTAFTEPSSPVERVIATLFGDVVGRDRVGAHDDFFDIGGDSVLATRLAGMLGETLQTSSISVSDLFAARTPETLARRLTSEASDSVHIVAVSEVFTELLEMSDEEITELAAESVGGEQNGGTR
ncbi:amino acid adenylation domain-containing protein [Gordonia sp. (in: high G+C Gram-positive bacteria)]|uniref:non-ribosomal peptide synthetase n=1 Tax=Gordonia sp. (in: high G+C Gram-positive bacteria) TaxID=84139 RepID=UPI003F96B820